MKSSAPEIRKTIPSTQRDANIFIEEAIRFHRKIREGGLCLGIDEYFFRLTLDEALQNSLHHGNAGDSGKMITIAITPSDKTITITVRDEGKGFSPNTVRDPRSPDNITRPGGRGLHLIKNFGQARWNEEGNEITIILDEERTGNAHQRSI
jgi:two-component sensor histidine kinase